MGAVVIDASMASAWCFPDEQHYTTAVFQAVSSSAVDTVAPRTWAYEVRNSVLMGLRRGRISKPDSDQFLISLNDLNVRLSDPASYDDLFSLAQKHGLTVYDAAWLNVAIQERLPLAGITATPPRA